MLWEIEIRPAANQPDREGARVLAESRALGAGSIRAVHSARSFLVEGAAGRDAIERVAARLLADTVVEDYEIRRLSGDWDQQSGVRDQKSELHFGAPSIGRSADELASSRPTVLESQSAADHSPLSIHHSPTLNVLFKPGVTDNVAASTHSALRDLGLDVDAVATCRKYRFDPQADRADLERVAAKVLSNDAIEHVVWGPLEIETISLGSRYRFQLATVPLRDMDDDGLVELSKTGQLYLSLAEMQTIRRHFVEQQRDPTDVELETIAQTWSEHCSHKTLTGRIHYREYPPVGQASPLAPTIEETRPASVAKEDLTSADPNARRTSGDACPTGPAAAPTREIHFENMLKETIFAATTKIREQLGPDDWCVSVFKDNAGIVRFDDKQNVCFKVETHNHPSALEPYGGANTGIGGVIRDPLGTGLGARPVCNTDVFCFAPPETPHEALPPGVLHPRAVAKGVVAGVRDYGNRMGIPTVNGAVYFDERYLGNPLVYCGNVATIPVDKCDKRTTPGDLIVAVGGRTGRDGIHGATFSSAELTEDSETLSGGAVQIGNAITEKMMADVILEARDRGLYSAITDCGAGGFSSAVGEMGEETGAEVWLEKVPLKYAGLSYTEIWISEAQERMVLAVPSKNWDELHALFESEGVEATVIGRFTDAKRLVLKYEDHQVADLSMHFLHNGRPAVVRDAVYAPAIAESSAAEIASSRPSTHHSPLTTHQAPLDHTDTLKRILAAPNVCSKEWIIRQYDHEVQAGSVVKPLVGVSGDGPSDAAVVRPDLGSDRGLVIACGMNPRYGDLDPYWMAASAIDEAVRNCVAVGADPRRIAILDNLCWGNTERPEVLGTLVRAALGCYDVAIAYGTPFISGKDSLYNEFSYVDTVGTRRTVAIPPSLLISALGQVENVTQAVTMDVKEPGNLIYLVGQTRPELGGSHYDLVTTANPPFSREPAPSAQVPQVNPPLAPRIFAAVHRAIAAGLVRSCHDLSEGGLAVAAAEMSFAGGWGLDLNLASLAESSGINDETVLLFSESNTRFLVEVPSDQTETFEAIFDGLPLVQLGRVAEHDRIRLKAAAARPLIDAPWRDLKDAWQGTLAWD